jgi:hypothetical protein
MMRMIDLSLRTELGKARSSRELGSLTPLPRFDSDSAANLAMGRSLIVKRHLQKGIACEA